MKISFVEIQNFRKLKSTRIDFDKETTIFVGANNSGKTSAMLALRYFFVSPKKLLLRDITIANWTKIDAIGRDWEAGNTPAHDLVTLLPSLDVWLDATIKEIHHVVHILPTINWKGGAIGVRLQYQPENIDKLRADYLFERTASKAMISAQEKASGKIPSRLWPISLTDFLEKRLSTYLDWNAYSLDTALLLPPKNGQAQPQALAANATPLDKNPFRSLIKVDEIAAQRDFADAGSGGNDDDKTDTGGRRFKRRLSDQLRSYYDRHLDPTKTPSAEDMQALEAIQQAELIFDTRLKTAFDTAFVELEDLGYPGITNPKIKINTQLRATDGIKHGSAIQYEVADPDGDGLNPLKLPEDYSGLGYQNLVSMVFMLMGYRDEWMKVGKASPSSAAADFEDSIQPLHLVFVEEPEAHLHAQVQQVFIKKAYSLLRNHKDLRDKDLKDLETYSTQLVVSTHSSHVAHEADFSCLRYFRRRRAASKGETPTTTIANLSTVFGDKNETQKFVKRYLKATHCDLFFADAAIFVEGQAERILIPHFIRHHLDKLSSRYLTLLEMGGSHTHRFKELIEELGITTLIISDLDAVKPMKKTNKNGVETIVSPSAKPQKGADQKTSNPVLKSWHPALEEIDKLLELESAGHVTTIGDDSKMYVAFQKGVRIKKKGLKDQEFVPRTFEDALIFENQELLKTLSGSSITTKIAELAAAELSGDDLADALFELLKNAEKAAFALDCLMIEDPKSLQPPTYIREGLAWLEKTLSQKAADELTPQVATK